MKTDLSKLTITNVKQIDAFKTICKCGYVNRPEFFHKICPICGRNLKLFTLTDNIKIVGEENAR